MNGTLTVLSAVPEYIEIPAARIGAAIGREPDSRNRSAGETAGLEETGRKFLRPIRRYLSSDSGKIRRFNDFAKKIRRALCVRL
jgi:hypothetical protein